VTRVQAGQRGFSLLEILVAFSILALSLGVLMQIFSGSLRNADITRDQAQAVILAQSLLSAAGVETPLAQGENNGVHAGKFRWLLRVSPFVDAASAAEAAAAPRQVLALDLWQVTVRVDWGEPPAAAERSVALTTLRARPVAGP
jgi:general secretion pathway protein I